MSGTPGISRDKLIAYLWPDADAERGRHLLSNSLYVLRQALGEDTLLAAGDVVRSADGLRCDVREFEEALSRGEPERAVTLYAGPLLDGFFLPDAPEFERWVERERERIASAHAHALESLAEAAEGRRDFLGAAAWWKRRAAHDPLDSRVALRLMRTLEAGGNRAGALQHAAVHQRLLREELGISATPGVTALVERLRSEPVPELSAPHPYAGARHGSRTAPDHEPPRDRSPPEAAAVIAGPSAAHSSATDRSATDTSAAAAMTAAASEPVSTIDGEDAAPPSSRAPTTGGRARRPGWPLAAAALLIVAALSGVLWTRLPHAVPPERSIVVLPFVNLTADDGNEYFSDGLAEEVILRLAALPELKVISRTSAMHYKGSSAPVRQIAQELGVAHVLEGTVRQGSGRLRVSARLLDAAADAPRWTASYDVEPHDPFGVQEEIVREVVRALAVKPQAEGRRQLARRGTRDPVAYELYRRGRFHWSRRTREDHAKAVEYYQRAIARDSGYAEPYAGLADAYLTSYQLGISGLSEAESYSRLKWAAERALALDDQSADAHASFAVSLWWQRNWPGAEREFRRTLALAPGNASARGWYALLLAGLGRSNEAVREGRLAAELDPFALLANINYAWVCYVARDYPCAVEQYRRALEINEAWPPAHAGLGLAYAQQRRYDDASREVSAALRARPQDRSYLSDLAYVYALAGRRAEAERLLHSAATVPGNEFSVARAWAALGQADSAFAWLERSAWQWPHRAVRGDPALDPLRADPRFTRISERVDREMGVR